MEEIIKLILFEKRNKAFYRKLYQATVTHQITNQERVKINMIVHYKKWSKLWRKLYLKTSPENRGYIYLNYVLMMLHSSRIQSWAAWASHPKFVTPQQYDEEFRKLYDTRWERNDRFTFRTVEGTGRKKNPEKVKLEKEQQERANIQNARQLAKELIND